MGLSTHWVFTEYCRAQEQYQEFLTIRDRFRDDLDHAYRRIKKLEKENDELKAQLKTLHTRQFKKILRKKQLRSKKEIAVLQRVIQAGLEKNRIMWIKQ